jgi:hypothetical protein
MSSVLTHESNALTLRLMGDDAGQKNVFWATIPTQNVMFLHLISSQVMIGKPLWCSWQHFRYGVEILSTSLWFHSQTSLSWCQMCCMQGMPDVNWFYQQVSSCKSRNRDIEVAHSSEKWLRWLIYILDFTFRQTQQCTN